MAMFLFDVQQRNRLSQKGLLKRFSIDCYGKQKMLEDIRTEKAEKFKELIPKKGTVEYDEWFLKYNPNDKRKKTKGNQRALFFHGIRARRAHQEKNRPRPLSKIECPFPPKWKLPYGVA